MRVTVILQVHWENGKQVFLILLLRSEQLFIPSFHLVVTMLQALHSALAPEVAPYVDFKHHWNMFLEYYAKQVR